MGRTLETYRVLLEHDKNIWTKHTKYTSYNKFTQELFDMAQKYADTGTYWSIGLIPEKIMFSILFSQYKKLQK